MLRHVHGRALGHFAPVKDRYFMVGYTRGHVQKRLSMKVKEIHRGQILEVLSESISCAIIGKSYPDSG